MAAEEYIDPIGYDRENGLDGPELPFYRALATETGGPGLDLACGTGYLTIPLADLGLAMTGLDLSRPMLDHARHKAGARPIRWVHADCRTFDLGETFALITLTGNAFQEFLTREDQEGLLGAVRKHLTPGGHFAFETRFPRPSPLFLTTAPAGEWSEEVFWRNHTDEQGATVATVTSQRHDPLRQTVEYRLIQRWQAGGSEREKVERTTLRFVYPQEMEALLHYNGLTIRAAYGDWDRRPLGNEGPRMIYVCGLRG